jgi:C4-dicarboxylate-specific signal transduction histidine kinase
MKLLIGINFILLATIMAGLYSIARANYGRLGASSRYWSIAIVCDAVGLALLGGFFIAIPDFTQSNRIGTVANTLLFLSTVYQAISIRALGAEITDTAKRQMLLGIAVFAVIWEIARINTDINVRILFFATCVLLVELWQLIELKKLEENSRQARIIRYSIYGEIFFTAMRLIAVSLVNGEIVQIEQLPVLGLFSIWIQYGLKIVVYAGLVAYWSEDLARQKAIVDLENQQFKILSARQEKLIRDLGRLNKAATAGVMAASIAHELSQPLQSLLLNVEVTREELGANQPNLSLLKETLNDQSISVDRMVQVINTMRGMFTESDTAEKMLDLNELTLGLTTFFNSLANKRGVKIEFVGKAGLQILGRPSELQQVVLNLVANAFDAVEPEAVKNKQIRIALHSESECVMCSVEDSGIGIPKESQKDVFKFLVTSKSTGMGLGLWLSKYIVERNKGEISVGTSELGGAIFSIKFPIAKP